MVHPENSRTISINRFLTYSEATVLYALPSTPIHFLYIAPSFFQFWKYSWSDSLGILSSSASKISLSSSTDSNHHPFCMDFSLGKRKSPLVQGLSSMEAGGWALSHVLWENYEPEGRNPPLHSHGWATTFSPPQIRHFSPHCLSQSIRHLS